MIQFRLKVFGENNEEGKKSNTRAGLEALGLSAGVLGSLGVGYNQGKKSFEKYVDKKGGESYTSSKQAYNKSTENLERAKKEYEFLEKKLGKDKILKGVGESNAQEIRNLIEKNRSGVETLKKSTEELKKGYLSNREKVLGKDLVLEKGIGRGLLKGSAVAGAGLLATYGAKKLYDSRKNKE